jgi:hypothetical protein
MRPHVLASGRVWGLTPAPMALHVLLALAVTTAGCGPSVPEYSVIDSPAGTKFKLESLEEMERPDGRPALLLRYRTDLDFGDADALESEVADVWEYLRPLVQARGMRVAVIRAAHWEPPSWERRGAAAQYVIEQSDSGSWAARPDTLSSESPS